MPKNLPYMKFFVRDWLADPKLSMCQHATRSVWLEAICAMHLSDTSSLSGTPEQLSRILRCDVAEVQSAVSDLSKTEAADISERNGVITIVSRRRQKAMDLSDVRSEAGRKGGIKTQANRQAKEEQTCVSVSVCNSPSGNGDARGKGLPPGFVRFWSEYPGDRKDDKKECLKCWNANDFEAIAETILAGLTWWKKHRDWTKENGRFIRAPLVFLHKKSWEAAGSTVEVKPPKPLTEAEKTQIAWNSVSMADRERLKCAVQIKFKGNDTALKAIDSMLAGSKPVDAIVEEFVKIRNELKRNNEGGQAA